MLKTLEFVIISENDFRDEKAEDYLKTTNFTKTSKMQGFDNV